MKTLILAALIAFASSAYADPAPATSWAVQNQPAATTAATISVAAGANIRHVATSVTVCVSGVAAQPALAFNLRDGATGAGTIVWTAKLSAAAGTSQCVTAPVFIVGTKGTAMTLESAAAPASTNFATVAVNGYDVYAN